jgi:hypothetical protein
LGTQKNNKNLTTGSSNPCHSQAQLKSVEELQTHLAGVTTKCNGEKQRSLGGKEMDRLKLEQAEKMVSVYKVMWAKTYRKCVKTVLKTALINIRQRKELIYTRQGS